MVDHGQDVRTGSARPTMGRKRTFGINFGNNSSYCLVGRSGVVTLAFVGFKQKEKDVAKGHHGDYRLQIAY